MTPEELQERTFTFSLQVHRCARPLLKNPEARHPAQQLIRAATSVAANYRAACLARSPAEFLAKIGIVREESDEALYWLKFILQAGVAGASTEGLTELAGEADQLVRIFAASYRTATNNRQNEPMGR